MATPTVLVTGAGGKTGKLIVQKLKERPQSFKVRALCRTEQSKVKLAAELKLQDSECVVADVANDDLTSVMRGCDALIVATSATPKINWASMPGFFFKRFVMQQKVMPAFTFPQTPEVVDWQGQKAQFDAAKGANVQHVLLVSSMGGTQKDNTLNKIGDGNILVWKRRAEEYLIGTGIPYTIFHPGGLKDGPGGERGIILDVDDKLLTRKVRSIARADVAELCVQSLVVPGAKNRSIDCINAGEGTTAPKSTEDFAALFQGMSSNCDYSIKDQPSTMTTTTA